jgi:hypothetical protein
VILYHYSSSDYLPLSFKSGVGGTGYLHELPALEPTPNEEQTVAPVVWLTTEADATKPPFGEQTKCLRIKLVIPTTDSKLKRYRLPADIDCPFAERARRTWWTYGAAIPAQWFRGFDYLDGIPYWLDESDDGVEAGCRLF